MSRPKLILASGSAARQQMLIDAGLEFKTQPADIDEEKIMQAMKKENASSGNIALSLAKEKARKISKENPDTYVVGSDQVLSLDDKMFSKVSSAEEARERLEEFQGKEHFLTSAVSVYKNAEDLWHKTDVAGLKMKPMDAQAIDKYMKIAGSALTECVGCYALEGAGIRLFKDIRGDYFTILGMPLLPLLNFLDEEGVLS